MKIKYLCPNCLPNEATFVLKYDDLASIELADGSCYDIVCTCGQTHHIFLQNPKYELLYDMGICAYLDGYYREAISDFAASLERFYEFCIFTLLGEKQDSQLLSTFWNQIKKQSERQYGAYLALFFNAFGVLPELPSNKQTEFRNNVIHKGYLPSKEETEQYAQYVGNLIIRVASNLPNDINAHFAGLSPILEEIKKNPVPRGGHNIITTISILKTGKSFEEALSEFIKFFPIFYAK